MSKSYDYGHQGGDEREEEVYMGKSVQNVAPMNTQG